MFDTYLNVRRDNGFIDKALMLLIFLMPLHSMLFDAIIPGSLDNLWRDALLLICLVCAVIKQKNEIRFGRYGMMIVIMWTICIVYTLLSDRLMLALNLARIYLLPSLIYLVIINVKYSASWMEKLDKCFLYTAVLVAVFGLFQAFVLGDSFLIALGYPEKNGHLSSTAFYIAGYYGIQRVTSTLTSPNICGAYLGIAIVYLSVHMKKYRFGLPLLGILLVGLVATFSRSAMVGVAAALIVVHFDKLINLKFLRISFFVAVPVLIAAVVVVNHKMDGLLLEMVISNLSSMLDLSDPSAAKHLEDLIEPLRLIWENPLGLGFGYNGPIALAKYGSANLVESAVYLLAYNFGMIGMAIFLAPYVRVILRMVFGFDRDKTVGGIAIMLIVTYLLLPNLEVFELPFFFFYFVARGEVMERQNVVQQKHQIKDYLLADTENA